MDPDRARQLYVSTNPEDHAPGYDFKRDMDEKAATDRRYAEVSRGVVDFQKISYRSSVGDMDIPAYLFQPLQKRGAGGHAAMVWVHGGVHGDWEHHACGRSCGRRSSAATSSSRPTIAAAPATARAHHNAIDYGGYEVDDVMSAVAYLKTLPHVDQDRLGHHGLEPRRLHHAVLGLPRRDAVQGGRRDRPGDQPGVPPVLQGPGYQRGFSTQTRIQGLPFEKRDLYIERSPLYHVDKLNDAAARARRDQRHRRELRRGPADDRRAAVAQAESRRDQGLRRSAARAGRAAATPSAGA